MLNWLRRSADDLFGRSGQWASVRREHLAREPACIACGRDDELEVHHVVPYHADKALECIPANLCTMCRDCHYAIGHAYDWKSWRPDVRRIAETIRAAKVCR